MGICCYISVMFNPWLRALLPLILAVLPAQAAPPSAGARMYREGRLPSGAPLEGTVKGDTPVPAQGMTCAHCHMRSGLGSVEGRVYTPPVSGPRLFQPAYKAFPRVTGADRERLGLRGQPLRPAYTDASLARALRTGLDPTSRAFSDIMPRYDMKDADMAILVRYLRTLSAQASPGVDGSTVRFATVIGEEVSLADRDAMLKPLTSYVAFHNGLSRGFGHRMYRTPAGREIIQDHRTFTLATWILKGPRATWRRQLEVRYRKEPLFALLGGISYGSWQPVHDFCEARQIPCLLPLTDFPVVSDRDWYTLYFSRGLRQEGEAAARFLAGGPASAAGTQVIQVVQGEAGQALAEGFQSIWRELRRPEAKVVRVPDLPALSPDFLRPLLAQGQPQVLLLWVGPEVLHALAPALAPEVEARAPGLSLVASSSLLKERLSELPDALRVVTYVTHPYRHPDDEARTLRNTVPSLAAQGDDGRIASRMYSLVQVLSKALMDLEGGLTRDHLLDRVDMLPDQVLPDFERLGFGPGQRYASKGCYIMQLTPGADPKLVKRSDWVTH